MIKNASKDMIFRKSILKICSDYKTIKNKIKLKNDDWGMSLDEFIDSKLQAVDNINDDDYVKIKQAVKILFSNSNNYDSEKVNSTIISVLDSILK